MHVQGSLVGKVVKEKKGNKGKKKGIENKEKKRK